MPLPVAADGVERLAVGGLAAAEAEQLLDGVSRGVVDRLRQATGGNPLAMLETAARLNPAQRVGAGPLPEPLPVGDRLERDYARLLAGLTPAAWRAVLLLAASHDEAEAPVVDALAAAGLDAEAALDEAQSRGVVDIGAGRVTFRHPLLRSAAWSVATAAQRRDAHRALAAALPAGAERVLQAAAATAGRNDALAEELASVAESMRARSGLAAASAAFERAAALSKDPDRAAGWLADAVDDAFLAGDTERARALGQRALDARTGSRPGAVHARAGRGVQRIDRRGQLSSRRRPPGKGRGCFGRGRCTGWSPSGTGSATWRECSPTPNAWPRSLTRRIRSSACSRRTRSARPRPSVATRPGAGS